MAKSLKTIFQLEELNVTLKRGCDEVMGCCRKVVLSSLDNSKKYEVTLTGDDALIPLEVGQRVIVDLMWNTTTPPWDSGYHVLSIKPLDTNVKFDFDDDWATRLV